MYRTQQGVDVIRSGSGFATISGIPFAVDEAEKIADSLKEYRRLLVLRSFEAAGIISELRTQVDYVLHGPNGAKLCVYVADFVYIENGKEVVEDVKGMKTAMYRLKKKMMRDEYGTEIHET